LPLASRLTGMSRMATVRAATVVAVGLGVVAVSAAVSVFSAAVVMVDTGCGDGCARQYSNRMARVVAIASRVSLRMVFPGENQWNGSGHYTVRGCFRKD